MSNPNPQNQWKPGESGNLKGRPKGLSITEIMKEELADIPEGEKVNYARILAKKMLRQAIVEGNVVLQKAIWAYVDGMPKQTIEGAVSIEKAIVEIVNADKNDGADSDEGNKDTSENATSGEEVQNNLP